uniref:Protein roadkill n=1 Tax=Syphacia muris TaxID=451379 RepID=A0A0N5APY9_9BILA
MMASQPSPPADPLQFQTSDCSSNRKPIIITVSLSSSASSSASSPVTTISTTTTSISSPKTVPKKGCKLYELITNSDEESESKKSCNSNDNSNESTDDTSATRNSSSSTVLLPSKTSLTTSNGNKQLPETGLLTSSLPTTAKIITDKTAVLRNRSSHRKYDEDKLPDAYFHPYAPTQSNAVGQQSQQLHSHRSVLKSSSSDLRSTAPVLYDLLSDDCDTENQQHFNATTLLPEPNASVPLLDGHQLLRPLGVQMPFVSTTGTQSAAAAATAAAALTAAASLPINQLPATYLSTLLQQNLLQTYSSVNLLKTAQPTNYLEDLPAVAPLLPSVLHDVLAFDDDAKKVRFFCFIPCFDACFV